MRATARLHHPVVNFDGPLSSHLVVSISGDDVNRLRPALGLVFVIDRSGSMSQDHKLETVALSLSHLADYLGAGDEIGLISFDTEVRVEAPGTAANASGLAGFHEAVGALRPRGGTDLDAGLAAGIAMANQMARRDSSRVVRVILLTDGQANAGVCEPAMIASRLESLSEGVSVSTIGVGLDCNHDLLGLVAERGRGSYGYVEAASLAPEVLGAEIGGLLNLDATSVVVEVGANKSYATIGEPLAVRSTQNASGGFLVNVGLVISGATKHLVFPVTLTPAKRPFARPVSVADVRVRGLVEDMEIAISLKPKTHFVTGETSRDGELDEAVDLARLAAAQREAERLASRRDFVGAASVLGSMTYTSNSVNLLNQSLASNYVSQDEYASGTVSRNSMRSMLSVDSELVGSSAAFDALASRTIGSYVSSAARDVAVETGAAVASSMRATVTVAGTNGPGSTKLTGGPGASKGPVALTGGGADTVSNSDGIVFDEEQSAPRKSAKRRSKGVNADTSQ